MANEIVTLAGMTKFFKDDLNCINKGELKFKADFVLELRNIEHQINAKVRASMEDRLYAVTLTVDGDGSISEGKCECPLAFQPHGGVGDLCKQTWFVKDRSSKPLDLKPKTSARQCHKTFSDLFPEPKPGYNPLSRSVEESDKQFLHAKLVETGLPSPF